MPSKTFCSDIIELCDVLRTAVIDTTGAEIPDSVRTIEWKLNLNEMLQKCGVRMPVPLETGSDEARGDAADSGNSGAKIQYMYNALHGQTGALYNFLNVLKQSKDHTMMNSHDGSESSRFTIISAPTFGNTAHWYDISYGSNTKNVQDHVKEGLHDLFESGPNDPNELNNATSETASYGDVVLSSNKIRDNMRDAGDFQSHGAPGTNAKDLNAKFISLPQLRDVLGQAADLGMGSSTGYNDVELENVVAGEARFAFSANDSLCFGVDVRDETILNKVTNGSSGYVNVDRWTIKLIQT